MSLPLSLLLRKLDDLAPLRWAEEWDNVGLLVDPRPPGRELDVERVLLAIDATQAVVEEAAAERVQCLIAYHPPLFRAVKRLRRTSEPAVYEAAARGYAIYSPHTALDAAPLGLNDWLVEGLGRGSVRPLVGYANALESPELKVVVFVPASHVEALRDALADVGAGFIGAYTHCSFQMEGLGTFRGNEGSHPAVGNPGQLEHTAEVRLEMVCARSVLPRMALAIKRAHPYEEPAWDVYALAAKPDPYAGSGRLIELDEPAPLRTLVERIKAHLGLVHVRVAASDAHARGALLRRAAVCAGAGGSLFERVHDADLFVTGEMRHHDVLEKLARGNSVVLCDHTNTERGYLPRFRQRLLDATERRVEIVISMADREPLQIM